MANLDRREFLGAAGAAVFAGTFASGCASSVPSTAGGSKAAASDLGYQSATDLASAIKARKVSSLEVVDHVIARIEKFDSALNAVVVRDFERAREAARAADAALQA